MCSGQLTKGIPSKMGRNFTSMGYAIGTPSGSLKSRVDKRILEIKQKKDKLPKEGSALNKYTL